MTCVDGNHTVFSFATAVATLPVGTTTIQLSLASPDENLVFAPLVHYSISAAGFNGAGFNVNETVGAGSAVVTGGPTIVSISAVPTEALDLDLDATTQGYSFSYSWTSAVMSSSGASQSLSIAFVVDVPAYLQQYAQVVEISVLSYLSSLVAIALGIAVAGTAIVYPISVCCFHRRVNKTLGSDVALTALTSAGAEDAPKYIPHGNRANTLAANRGSTGYVTHGNPGPQTDN